MTSRTASRVRRTRARHFSSTVAFLGACLLGLSLHAQVSPNTSTLKSAQANTIERLRALEAEVLALREQLRLKEASLDQLRREAGASPQSPNNSVAPALPTPSTTQVTSPVASQTKAVSVIESQDVPSLSESDKLDVSHLLAWFARNSAPDVAQLEGRTFTLHGTVSRFSGATLQRKFWAEFDAPPNQNPSRLRVQVMFPAGWDGVFVSRDQQRLVRRGEQSTRTLLQKGDTLTLRARFKAFEGDTVVMDRGEWRP